MLLNRAVLLQRLHHFSDAQADYLSEWNIPPREPQLSRKRIDLSRYYNAAFEEPFFKVWHNGNYNLTGIAQGHYPLLGVEFDIRGVIKLNGLDAQRLSVGLPTRVESIKIGLRCRQLHFLQAAFGVAEEGTMIGGFKVRLIDGRNLEVPIVYGIDLRAWADEADPVREAGHSKLIVAGQNPAGQAIRLYLRTWENPLPEVEIASLDFIAAMAVTGPFLVAITAE